LETFSKIALDDLNRKARLLSRISATMDAETVNNLSRNTITTDAGNVNV